MTDKKGYKLFRGDFRTYHIQTTDETCLYDVPANQLRFLSQYRNKRVRLICFGYVNQYAPRWFKVGIVPKEPKVQNVVRLTKRNRPTLVPKKIFWGG